MSAGQEVDASLRVILKSHDRIGFGRRGVLDAEPEIRRFAASLPKEDLAHFHRLVVSWLDEKEAERLTTPLHYNLPEHLQTLAIRLCASIPILESLPLLRRLQAEDVFNTESERFCREALDEAVALLTAHGSDTHSER